MGKELLMHLFDKNEDFLGPLPSVLWRQPKIQVQKKRVKFVVSFTFTTRLNSGIGLPNIVRIQIAK